MLNRAGHINNLYNTAFWVLVQQGGLDNKEASKTLDVRYAVATKTHGARN
jgi:tRNA(His) 5'-end guanylyltransferase